MVIRGGFGRVVVTNPETVTWVELLGERDIGKVQATVPFEWTPPAEADWKVTSGGKISVMTTPSAEPVEALLVKVMV